MFLTHFVSNDKNKKLVIEVRFLNNACILIKAWNSTMYTHNNQTFSPTIRGLCTATRIFGKHFRCTRY